MRSRTKVRLDIVLICMALFALTFAVYFQVYNHEFINFDDDLYVTANKHVFKGLSRENISWAFSFDKRGTYWHPLTWLSHMLDCQLFGLDSGLHHLTNLFFHIANTLLLFFVLSRMTGALWKSAFVAALFALHPINVDSVAWIAERKNLLSTFFWMLTMLAYIYYAARPGVLKYLLTILFFTFGLLAKPMLVTLPFVLLLMDYWPLGRIRFKQARKEECPVLTAPYAPSSLFRLILEKVPLFVLSACSILISSLSLKQAGEIIPSEWVPMALRLANALISYVKYIGKMLWPVDLAILYPYPTTMFPLWQVAGASLLLLVITTFVLYQLRRYPYLPIGWFWYLGTLFPVSGLVQGGVWPAMADRWAYVPLIGLFIMIAWGFADLTAQWRYKKVGLISLALTIIVILTAITHLQLLYWENNLKLFGHTLNVTDNNAGMHNNFAAALVEQKRTNEAIYHYTESLRINPNLYPAHIGLGNIFLKQGNTSKALNYYGEALKIAPDNADAHFNMGNALKDKGVFDEAISHYNEVLRIEKEHVGAHVNRGVILAHLGKLDGAMEDFNNALALDPDNADAHTNVGNILRKQGNIDEAIRHYNEALRTNPDNADAHFNLGVALQYNRGDMDGAVLHYKEALRIHPDFVQAHDSLGTLLFNEQGKIDEAIDHFTKAIEIDPSYSNAHKNLKRALEYKEKSDRAIAQLKKSVELNPADPVLHDRLGTLYQARGMLDWAIEHYQEALSIRPEFIQALNNLSLTYMKKGDYESALSSLERIMELKPDSVAAHYNMACLYAKQNRKEESVTWLRRAIGFGFNDWKLLRMDSDLKNIRETRGYKEIIEGH